MGKSRKNSRESGVGILDFGKSFTLVALSDADLLVFVVSSGD